MTLSQKLCEASYKRDIEECSALLIQGAEIDCYSEMYDSPLANACGWGYIELINLFLNAGASVNYGGEYNFTPLWVASGEKLVHISKILIEKGADIDSQDDVWHDTPLMRAVKSGDLEMCRLLIKNGSDIDSENEYNYTALDIAEEMGHMAIVNLIKNISVRDKI